MQEDFLHYLWRLKRFDISDLKTTQGEALEIRRAGQLNPHAGPDFTDARIRIGDTLWAGNVEMHLLASDWRRHGHQDDEAYANVILHVVLEEDEPILRPDGQRLPCLELKKRVPRGLAGIYAKLMHSEYWIPCQPQFSTTAGLTRQLWLDRLLVERLEEKTAAIHRSLQQQGGDWEATFYQYLARNFGVRVNAEPFEQLARSLPLQLLLKHRQQLFQLEALLFGQSGLLTNDWLDAYPRRLRKEYQHLAGLYGLSPMPAASWKFLRLRPAGFPTVRIAQFATLLHQTGHLFSKVLAARNIREVENMFEVRLSNYWKNHYVFDKESPSRPKALGRSAVHLLIINAIVPFLFLYGAERREERLQQRALRLLEEVPAENNQVIRHWRALGMDPRSAYQSQALLQLKKRYCARHRCLQCAIGHAILGRTES